MRLVNYGTLVAPYDLCACADVGDVPVNPIDVEDTLRRIEAEIDYLHQGGVTPLSIGGDHIISYPILRALGAKRPLGMIHVDAHSDTGDTYFGGQKLTHGTPFRRAIEDGVLDPKRMVQIGIRGTMYSADERQWALDQGIRIIDMEEVVEKGIPYAVAEARRIVGMEPTYFTFDIDSIDPAFAPGTGTPEIGGLPAARRCNWSAASATSTSSAPTWWKSRRRSTNPAARRWSAPPSPSSFFACWPRRATSSARERCGSNSLRRVSTVIPGSRFTRPGITVPVLSIARDFATAGLRACIAARHARCGCCPLRRPCLR